MICFYLYRFSYSFSGIASFILKWLPDNQNHDVLFYSSLLAKLMEGSERIIDINMHIEQMTRNVTLRHPQGIKTLLALSPEIIKKGLEALTDAERTQVQI